MASLLLRCDQMLYQERRFLRKYLGYEVYNQLMVEYKYLLRGYYRLKEVEVHLETLINDYEIEVLAEYQHQHLEVVTNEVQCLFGQWQDELTTDFEDDLSFSNCDQFDTDLGNGVAGCSLNSLENPFSDSLQNDVFRLLRYVKKHRDFIKFTLQSVSLKCDRIREISQEIDRVVSESLYEVEKLSCNVFAAESRLKGLKNESEKVKRNSLYCRDRVPVRDVIKVENS